MQVPVAQLPVRVAAKEVHVLALDRVGDKIGPKDDHVGVVCRDQNRVPSLDYIAVVDL